MDAFSDRLLAEIPCLDPVYVDGILEFTALGTNFGTVYFRLVPVKSENGGVIYERTPVLYLIRPKAGANEMIKRFAHLVGAPMMPPFNVIDRAH